MGRISKKIINQALQRQLEDQLSFIVSSLTDKNEIDTFLNEFLTKEEKIMLGKRLILCMLLEKGWTSSQIHVALSMSYETIRWYKTLFESKPEIFKETIRRLIKRENNKELWGKLDIILEPLTLIMKARNDMRARAKLSDKPLK